MLILEYPNPETETLVNWVKEKFSRLQQEKNARTLSLLDIGTGCGLLPITLGKELPIETTAVDLSERALEVAQENAKLNNAEVDFIQGDVLKWTSLPKQFDIIVSNPPYILEKSRKDVPRNFLDYEPPVALYVKDEDPMLFNRKIAELAKES
ncbi:HemK family putative methylases [Salegentibacter salinarum]|nr:HemK family putative methylases [Salegentibacter salinarum]